MGKYYKIKKKKSYMNPPTHLTEKLTEMFYRFHMVINKCENQKGNLE